MYPYRAGWKVAVTNTKREDVGRIEIIIRTIARGYENIGRYDFKPRPGISVAPSFKRVNNFYIMRAIQREFTQ